MEHQLCIKYGKCLCGLFLSDLNRTFPDNVQFRKTSSPSLQKALYNVLLAYGHHNPAVGYCQVIHSHVQNHNQCFSSHNNYTGIQGYL